MPTGQISVLDIVSRKARICRYHCCFRRQHDQSGLRRDNQICANALVTPGTRVALDQMATARLIGDLSVINKEAERNLILGLMQTNGIVLDGALPELHSVKQSMGCDRHR